MNHEETKIRCDTVQMKKIKGLEIKSLWGKSEEVTNRNHRPNVRKTDFCLICMIIIIIQMLLSSE